MRQSRTHKETVRVLSELQELTLTVDVTKSIIRNSLRSEFKDFEDAIQYNCAKSMMEVDCIVSRDTKDFRLSSIPVLSPKEAVAMVKS